MFLYERQLSGTDEHAVKVAVIVVGNQVEVGLPRRQGDVPLKRQTLRKYRTAGRLDDHFALAARLDRSVRELYRRESTEVNVLTQS